MSNDTIDTSLCTLATCPISASFFAYRPSLAINSTFLALFGLSLLANAFHGISYKTWGFFVAMAMGNLTEIVGYGGRIWAYYDPFNINTFLIQICCLTVAPVFFAAAIYLCLSRIVIVFGAEISRLPPKRYTQLFVSCDVVSLILQASGGAIASITSTNKQNPSGTLGINIMLGGLSFQVFTLTLFILLCLEFALRIRSDPSKLDPAHEKIRASKKFKGLLAALVLSTLCILIRSVYRVIEMSQGWNGKLICNQTYFVVLEGIMVVVAVLALTLFHPGWVLGESSFNARKGDETPDVDEKALEAAS
ncbi:hypothetical protein RUND412_007839 [Rhizina undulata]